MPGTQTRLQRGERDGLRASQTGQRASHVDDPIALGERLRAARKRSGLSQSALAGRACSAAYISRIEAGERVPSLQLLELLARRLGVSRSWLAQGADRAAGRQQITPDVRQRLAEFECARQRYERLLGELLRTVKGTL